MAIDDRDLAFRSTPSPRSRSRKYDILRVPGPGAGNLVLLGHCFAWHDLHYWRKRTVPHFEKNCEPCEDKVPVRERGYIAVTPRNKVDVMILEVTGNCEKPITAAMVHLVSLRGQVVGLKRLDKAPNGKLYISFSGQCIDSDLLPASPDVEEVMRRIWGLPKRKPMLPPDAVVMDMAKLRCSVQLPSTNGKAS